MQTESDNYINGPFRIQNIQKVGLRIRKVLSFKAFASQTDSIVIHIIDNCSNFVSTS